MKNKEVFISVLAFTLLLMTFCIVTITANNTDKIVNESAPQQSSESQKSTTNKTFVHSSSGNLAKTTQKPELKRTPLVTSNHPVDLKANAWSSSERLIRPDIKDRLTPVELDGRVYLEDTTGSEVCDSNDQGDYDQGNIEIIE